MSKPPAFQFYCEEYLGSLHVRCMSRAQELAYLRLLIHQWDTESCKLPNDPKILAHIARMTDKEWQRDSRPVMARFRRSKGRIWNAKLFLQRQALESYCANKKAAGKQGGISSGLARKQKGSTPSPLLEAKRSSPSPSLFPSPSLSPLPLTAQQKQPCSSTDERFAAFWQAYPRKVGKASALRSYLRAVKTTTPAAILASVEKQKGSSQWKREAGKFIPHPTTWLNQGRWDDEPVMPKLPHIHVAPVEQPAEKEFLAMLDKRFLGAPNGLVSARTDDGDGSGSAGQPDAVPGADPGGDGPTPPV